MLASFEQAFTVSTSFNFTLRFHIFFMPLSCERVRVSNVFVNVRVSFRFQTLPASCERDCELFTESFYTENSID